MLRGINVILTNFFRTTAQVNKVVETKMKEMILTFITMCLIILFFWFFKDENYKTYFCHYENESQSLNKIKFQKQLTKKSKNFMLLLICMN